MPRKSKPIQHQPRPASLPADAGFVRLPLVLELFPVSEATWHRGIKEGRYPKGVKLGPRVTAWRVADILRLLSEGTSNEPKPPREKITRKK